MNPSSTTYSHPPLSLSLSLFLLPLTHSRLILLHRFRFFLPLVPELAVAAAAVRLREAARSAVLARCLAERAGVLGTEEEEEEEEEEEDDEEEGMASQRCCGAGREGEGR